MEYLVKRLTLFKLWKKYYQSRFKLRQFTVEKDKNYSMFTMLSNTVVKRYVIMNGTLVFFRRSHQKATQNLRFFFKTNKILVESKDNWLNRTIQQTHLLWIRLLSSCSTKYDPKNPLFLKPISGASQNYLQASQLSKWLIAGPRQEKKPWSSSQESGSANVLATFPLESNDVITLDNDLVTGSFILPRRPPNLSNFTFERQ